MPEFLRHHHETLMAQNCTLEATSPASGALGPDPIPGRDLVDDKDGQPRARATFANYQSVRLFHAAVLTSGRIGQRFPGGFLLRQTAGLKQQFVPA